MLIPHCLAQLLELSQIPPGDLKHGFNISPLHSTKGGKVILVLRDGSVALGYPGGP